LIQKKTGLLHGPAEELAFQAHPSSPLCSG